MQLIKGIRARLYRKCVENLPFSNLKFSWYTFRPTRRSKENNPIYVIKKKKKTRLILRNSGASEPCYTINVQKTVRFAYSSSGVVQLSPNRKSVKKTSRFPLSTTENRPIYITKYSEVVDLYIMKAKKPVDWEDTGREESVDDRPTDAVRHPHQATTAACTRRGLAVGGPPDTAD